MRFQTSQQMTLGQQMKLAPRMIQSMEILQLPLHELQERIEQELESNVTLEVSAQEPGEQPADASDPASASQQAEGESRELHVGDADGASDFERLDAMESSYSEAFENEYSAAAKAPEAPYEPGVRRSDSGERDGKMDAMANTAARAPSLVEQLQRQWGLAGVDARTRAAGDALLEHVDADGYIRVDLASLAAGAGADDIDAGQDLACACFTVDELGAALRELQARLDPAGVAARDTRECLLLQLDSFTAPGAPDPPFPDVLRITRLLITEHMDDLLHNRLPKIARETELAMSQIHAAKGLMRRLRIAPGRDLVDDASPSVVPDAIVEYDEEKDRYFAYLNDRAVPGLRINREYARMVSDETLDKETKRFIKTNLGNARWLLEAVEQRSRTLLRVLNVVCAAQRSYFESGPSALRPLPMTDVADQLGVHVATVSRAVAGKHVQTPYGIASLRGFFSGGRQTDDGESVSWGAIRAALQDVVDSEDKSAPLSDDALALVLKDRGIEIARRTVAKYRQQLDIPAARLRKQH